ncbi:YhdT family protein [Planococcus sp. CP5-4]|uniref:YhdT family protein n=1 Tax=unclassified Planococcus (in: firmicutes) TaxID=2662419 RepID=UPI001C224D17|nr:MULTISPECIES: YhdT family protein [unclassified Planococcus (in: firmicutes)]MBU9673438.1 YhdT family protein [Planococcus sp. CP5-4_YE]MBV0908211.1 YhdT family protein [Planococcus sp. CP5-4_UN]MBW6062272.1 YhdT family protein [Planococcus sp. CP5-4]
MKETDWRFRVAHREAWIGLGLALFNFVWWFAFAYGLGSRPVEEYTYIFGLPDWFFYSCIVGFLVMVVLVTVVVKLFFIDVPFDEEQEESR